MEHKQKYDVFISYSRKDTTIANKICNALDKKGISYFIDRQGIGGGQEFPEVLADAIIGCRIMLYLASANSYNSKFTNSEITFAFNEKPKGSILPYILDGSRLPATQRFIFAGVNIRTLEEHPIDTILIQDLCQLLGSKETEEARKKATEEAKRKAAEEERKQTVEFSRLGDDYYYGRNDKPKDYGEAVKWYRKAAELGNAYAQYSLGWCLEHAQGIREDCSEAIKWYQLAAEQGHEEAYNRIDLLYNLTPIIKRKKLFGKKYYGYADDSGNVVIPCQWEVADYFSEGLAGIKDANHKWGFINKTGKVVIPCQWNYVNNFSEGLACVEDANYKHGFINKKGDVVIPCQWDLASDFSGGVATVKIYKDGKFEEWEIDKTGTIIPHPQKDKNGLYGYVNESGTMIIPAQWKWAENFSEGYASVQGNNYLWGYIDKTGKEIIPCQYIMAYKYSEGLASVRKENETWGYIDKTGKEIIPCQWAWAASFYNGYAIVHDKEGKRWKIDKTGKVVGEVK